jgi:hypothetical protein
MFSCNLPFPFTYQQYHTSLWVKIPTILSSLLVPPICISLIYSFIAGHLGIHIFITNNTMKNRTTQTYIRLYLSSQSLRKKFQDTMSKGMNIFKAFDNYRLLKEHSYWLKLSQAVHSEFPYTPKRYIISHSF